MTGAGKDQRGKTNNLATAQCRKRHVIRPWKGSMSYWRCGGFDLLAHVEAMLRHARQYNQEVKQLRSHLGKGQTDTEQVSLDAVLQRGRQHCSVKLFARWKAEAVREADFRLEQTVTRGDWEQSPTLQFSRIHKHWSFALREQ